MKYTLKVVLVLTFLSFSIFGQNISKEEKEGVLNHLIQNIEKIYPFPEISQQTINGIRGQISTGFYNNILSPSEFASQVTSDLEMFSKDKHLDLLYNPELAKALLEESDSNSSSYTDEEAKIEIWNNYGFKDLRILDGNIGYLNLTVFFATNYAGKIADTAMNYFSNCNALIIDLRQNGGGWGDMVEYLLAYFIDDDLLPLLLDISHYTTDGTIYSSVVKGYVPGKKLTNIPIYILTSRATASAAEGFTSHMKYFNKNVKIFGNLTSGAENPVTHLAINEEFVLQIPAVIKTFSSNPQSWEGIGIKPDIEVEIDDAFKVAHQSALEELIKDTNNMVELDKYQWALDGLRANYSYTNVKNIEKYAGNYHAIKIINKNGKIYIQYKGRPLKLLIPITNNYFIVDSVDYYRIKFIFDVDEITVQQIFSYGAVHEYSKEK